MDHDHLITFNLRMLDRKFILYLLNVNLYITFNHVVSLLSLLFCAVPAPLKHGEIDLRRSKHFQKTKKLDGFPRVNDEPVGVGRRLQVGRQTPSACLGLSCPVFCSTTRPDPNSCKPGSILL